MWIKMSNRWNSVHNRRDLLIMKQAQILYRLGELAQKTVARFAIGDEG